MGRTFIEPYEREVGAIILTYHSRFFGIVDLKTITRLRGLNH